MANIVFALIWVLIISFKNVVMGVIKEVFKREYSLTDDSLEAIFCRIEELNFRKGDLILRLGQYNEYYYFIDFGMVKTWFIREDRENMYIKKGSPWFASRKTRSVASSVATKIINKFRKKQVFRKKRYLSMFLSFFSILFTSSPYGLL